MAALPETQRQALVLRELEGRTYAEISRSLDLSESAVETLIFRARRALREQIENAMSCEEFAELLDDPAARTRVRAHARICPECATLDHQSRGRKSALKRIASSLGLPWWGVKLTAIALTTATVAAVAVAVPHDPTQPSIPVSNSRLNVVRPAAVVRPHQLNLIPTSSRPKLATSRGGTRFKSFVPTAIHAATAPAAVLPGPEAPIPTTPEPEPSQPTPAPLPSPTKIVPVTPPAAAPVPAVTVPQTVLPPAPEPPAVTIPTASVPIQTPALPAVTLPVATPNVSLP
jgi:hypothetical protein